MREHIDFVQAQHLPWESGEPLGLPASSEIKVLSFDDQTGELSAVIRVPPQNFIDRDTARDLEFLVLEGDLLVDSQIFSRYHYGFVPAGETTTVSSGAARLVALLFTSPVHDAQTRSAGTVERRRSPRQDLTTGVWDGNFDKFNLASMKEGAQMRILREDPISGETTYLTATIAFRRGKDAERHPITQEFFLLSGELAGERGIMQAGAYCIRPPMAKHGPYGSPTGALLLFRGLGGPQQTHWESAPSFRFDPPHDPILPERLAPYAQPVERTKVY